MKGINMKRIIVAAVVACSFQGFAQTEIKLMTAASVYHELFSKIEGPFAQKHGLKLNYLKESNLKVLGGPLLLETLLKKEAEAAIAANTYEGWVNSYKEAKKGDAMPTDGLTHRVIGKELIRIIAHKTVGVKHLTMDQAKKLFSGAAKNWKDVGGANFPVTVFLQDAAVSRTKVFEAKVLKGLKFAANSKTIAGSDALKKTVASTPGALSFFPDAQIAATDNLIEMTTDEEIGRPITLVTVGKPNDSILKLLQFIETDGKAILSKK